ncbi:hypothetical protein [Alicyclobacillus acidoterrestris]|uniref:Uncharacterized protein n=1 Tax=Alicyclobacillus acidoterrestris (strain ATCC 49025 / DSM 3922 / CIP 106132 / NCIMB 13137 / GD3B) TaxID=1356854 RepID=T0CIL2_ALIAG|nr:hypothetical protein [Alicyclobacillus acidoterrestris]EPZ52624.1 hypothetical protein N007_20105 [Alicyclobacillus acidoterrestris ATCC 49025]UNO48265.1 hypothetical protein K1I37_16535 [Alicyclobacillus acidoterrestris]
MEGEKRKQVYFNLDADSDVYEEANTMQFSTEVKRWLRERVARKKALQIRTKPSELTIDTTKLGGDR